MLSLNEVPSFLRIITSLPSLVVTALMQRIRASRSIISVIHWRLLPVILLRWIILWRPIVPSTPLHKTLLIVRYIPLLVRSGISLSIISWLVRVSILLTEPTTLVSTIMDRRWPWCYNTILILVSSIFLVNWINVRIWQYKNNTRYIIKLFRLFFRH